MRRFGISEVTTWPWTFEDDARRYPALGAEAIEIWEFKLDDNSRGRRERANSAWNLEDALDIVQAVGEDTLGICADAWNLAGQFDLQARLVRCAKDVPDSLYEGDLDAVVQRSRDELTRHLGTSPGPG
jgi:hypothetical protein